MSLLTKDDWMEWFAQHYPEFPASYREEYGAAFAENSIKSEQQLKETIDFCGLEGFGLHNVGLNSRLKVNSLQ